MSTATAPNRLNQTSDPGLQVLNDLLAKSKDQIRLALPKHLTPERMIRMALTLYGKNDQLKKCTPLSIIGCVIQASELGLELSSPLGHAWMVPYKDVATFQIGYKGFIELAFRSGKVSSLPMRTVYANDIFDVRYGTDQKIIHKPALKDRGEVIGYYAAIYLKDGGRDFEWMSNEDIDQHYKQYVKFKRDDGPWKTSRDAMAMKTCVRMLAKRIPVSTELAIAVQNDEMQEAGLDLGTVLVGETTPTPTRADTVESKIKNGKPADPMKADQAPTKKEKPADFVPASASQLQEIDDLLPHCGLSLKEALDGLIDADGKPVTMDNISRDHAAAVLRKIAKGLDAEKAKAENEMA